MGNLADKQCVPCRGGVPPLPGAEQETLLKQLPPGWQVVNAHHLQRQFDFSDFAAALTFTNQVGSIAEEQGHHPEIHLGWGKVRLEIWTHAIDGLTESDFILAAKIDGIPRP